MKKQATIAQQRLFFFDLATLTIVCILQYESHFPCFCFYQVFRKKCFKFQSKTKAQKNIRKCCPWGRKTHPKCIKIQCFSFRKHQIAPKNWFWGWLFFYRFFESQFFHFLAKFGVQMKSRAKTTFTLLRQFWRSKPIFWRCLFFYRFFSQKCWKNVENQCRLTEKLTEWNLNSIHNPMPGSPIFPKVRTHHYLTKPPHERVHWTLPKASYPQLPYQPSKSKGGGRWLGFAATINYWY